MKAKNIIPWNKGKTLSVETRLKMSKSKTGELNPFYGRHHTEEFKANRTGEKHPCWKGDDVSRTALHFWVRRRLGEMSLCQFCNKQKARDLACVTGIYNRELSNWKYLCSKCHVRHDFRSGLRGPHYKYPLDMPRRWKINNFKRSKNEEDVFIKSNP